MARKRKFDSEWEQALSLLPPEDAAEARTIIEDYQQTGIMPSDLKPNVEMILLLVKPMIDRRRRASESSRRRRLLAKKNSDTETETSTPSLQEPEPTTEPTTESRQPIKQTIIRHTKSIGAAYKKAKQRNLKRKQKRGFKKDFRCRSCK